MRILMTGANSYLGGRTVPLLRAAGHEVVALTRPDTQNDAFRRLGIASCSWDDAPPASTLVHLATLFSGQTRPGEEGEIVRANVMAPTDLVARFVASGGARVVAAGTCWEDCGAERRAANLYASSKAAFRTISSQLCGERGRQLVWLRLTDIVGPDDPRERLFTIVRDSIERRTPLAMTPGEQPFDPVWIDDAAEAVATAVDARIDPATVLTDVGIAGGQPRSLREKIQPIFDRRGCPDLPLWGARPYRRGEPFFPNWRPGPEWWRPRRSYRSIVDEMFAA